MPHGADMKGANYRTAENVSYFALLEERAIIVSKRFPTGNYDCCLAYAADLGEALNSVENAPRILDGETLDRILDHVIGKC